MPDRLDWSSSIGLFLINYGTLDYFVFVFLKDRLSSDEFDQVKEQPFKTRVTRIAEHLRHEKEREAFDRLMERVEPIRQLRNHLAHGHMYVCLEPGTLTPTVTVFRAKDVDTGLMPDATHVEFAELQAGLKTLGELIEEFRRIAGFADANSD